MVLVLKNPPTIVGDLEDLGSIPGWEDLPLEAQQPTPVFLPVESNVKGNLVGYGPCVTKSCEVTEVT